MHTAESGQGGTEDVGEYKSSSDCCLLLETACKPVCSPTSNKPVLGIYAVF